MIIGGLSEKEVNEIKDLLDAEKIPLKVGKDESMLQSNKESMKYDLRHLSSPSISTHVLSIELEESAFEAMSDSLKQKLLDRGITNIIPDEIEFSDKETVGFEPIQTELNKGNKRLVGHNFLHQIFLLLGAAVIYSAIKFLIS